MCNKKKKPLCGPDCSLTLLLLCLLDCPAAFGLEDAIIFAFSRTAALETGPLSPGPGPSLLLQSPALMSSPARSSADHLSTTIPVIKRASSSSSSSQTSAFSVQPAFVSVVPRGTWKRFLLPAGQDKSSSVSSSGRHDVSLASWTQQSLTDTSYLCLFSTA